MVNPRNGGDVVLKWLGLAIVLFGLATGAAIAYSRLDTTVANQQRRIESLEQISEEMRNAIVRIDKSLAVIADRIRHDGER